LNKGFAKIINGATGGLNWAMTKLGIDFVIPKWNPPQYAKGTSFHPGGPAIVGEKGRELIHANGQMFMAERQQMINLPRGASVLTNSETESLLRAGFPGYAGGVGKTLKGLAEGAKNAGLKAWGAT
ncbi:hypothetical protein, partial [Acinetobacter baumannii]|uniref:hypothetical protein n=1 Tax=Acinetobacter baumannii TaxID=470 RepID=UPI000AF150F7